MSKEQSVSPREKRDGAADLGKSGKKPGKSNDAPEKFLAGYPGAALLVGADGSVTSANAKAAGLEALIQHEAAPEIIELINEARTSDSVAAGSVSLSSGPIWKWPAACSSF